MPSLSVHDFGVYLAERFDAIIPVWYNKKLHFVCILQNSTYIRDVHIIDVENKTYQSITPSVRPNYTVFKISVIDYNMKGTKLHVRYYGGSAGEWDGVKCVEGIIDLSGLTAEFYELWKLTEADDADLQGTWQQKHEALSNRLVLFADRDKPYIWYIDPKDGSIVHKLDTGFGTYNPRPTRKFIIKPDDIYVLLGRHLSGDPYYILKLYSKTVTVISGSNPGSDSPLRIGNDFWGEKDVLFTGSGTTVDNSQPDLCWFDWDLNLLGKTDLQTFYTYAHPYGWHIIGKDENDNILMLISICDNDDDLASVADIYLLRISRSDFSIVENILLKRWTDMEVARYMLSNGEYAGYTNMGVIDKNKQKLYMLSWNAVTSNPTTALLELDFSDITVKEWNLMSYYSPYARIPTQLSLQITPL